MKKSAKVIALACATALLTTTIFTDQALAEKETDQELSEHCLLYTSTDIFYSSLSGFIKAAGIFPACRWFITFPGNDLFL